MTSRLTPPLGYRLEFLEHMIGDLSRHAPTMPWSRTILDEVRHFFGSVQDVLWVVKGLDADMSGKMDEAPRELRALYWAKERPEFFRRLRSLMVKYRMLVKATALYFPEHHRKRGTPVQVERTGISPIEFEHMEASIKEREDFPGDPIPENLKATIRAMGLKVPPELLR